MSFMLFMVGNLPALCPACPLGATHCFRYAVRRPTDSRFAFLFSTMKGMKNMKATRERCSLPPPCGF